jgi:hypothetical protein
VVERASCRHCAAYRWQSFTTDILVAHSTTNKAASHSFQAKRKRKKSRHRMIGTSKVFRPQEGRNNARIASMKSNTRVFGYRPPSLSGPIALRQHPRSYGLSALRLALVPSGNQWSTVERLLRRSEPTQTARIKIAAAPRTTSSPALLIPVAYKSSCDRRCRSSLWQSRRPALRFLAKASSR